MGYYGFYLLASIANFMEHQCKKINIVWVKLYLSKGFKKTNKGEPNTDRLS